MKLHEIDLREDGTSKLVGLELEPFISTGRKECGDSQSWKQKKFFHFSLCFYLLFKYT